MFKSFKYSLVALVLFLAAPAFAMPHRIVDAEGGIALGAGSPSGMELVDTDTGTVLGTTSGRYTDAAIVNGIAVGLKITPGNPGVVDMRVFSDGLSSHFTVPSFNPPYGGRIDALGSNLYWQLDHLVRVYDFSSGTPMTVRTIDTGLRAVDVAAIPGGFVVLSGGDLFAFSDSGNSLWTVSPTVDARKVVSSDRYVITIGGSVPDGQARKAVSSVYAHDGSLVAELTQRGFEFASCAGGRGGSVFLGRPEYSTPGSVTGAVEMWDVDSASITDTVDLAVAPLDLSVDGDGNPVVATNIGLITVKVAHPIDDGVVVNPVDPFDSFIQRNQGIDPSTSSTLELVGQLLGFTSAEQYAALYMLIK